MIRSNVCESVVTIVVENIFDAVNKNRVHTIAGIGGYRKCLILAFLNRYAAGRRDRSVLIRGRGDGVLHNRNKRNLDGMIRLNIREGIGTLGSGKHFCAVHHNLAHTVICLRCKGNGSVRARSDSGLGSGDGTVANLRGGDVVCGCRYFFVQIHQTEVGAAAGSIKTIVITVTDIT